MQKLALQFILFLSLALTFAPNLIGQEEQLTDLEIEELIQGIINQSEVKGLIKSMKLVKNMENQIFLILDNGVIPNQINLKFDNMAVGFGTIEEFFSIGGDRIVFDSLLMNGNYAEIYFTVFLTRESIFKGWTKFNQFENNWALEESKLNQVK